MNVQKMQFCCERGRKCNSVCGKILLSSLCLFFPNLFCIVVLQEQKRPPHGLVKILCLPFEGRAQQTKTRFSLYFETSCWVDSMFVWFPAAWMPLVVEAIRAKNVQAPLFHLC